MGTQWIALSKKRFGYRTQVDGYIKRKKRREKR